MKKSENNHPKTFYRLFKLYIYFFYKIVFCRRYYVIDKQYIPKEGTPTLIVSNHQNGMIDSMGTLFSFKKQIVYFLTRGDVFKNSFANRFLRSLGMLPIFRANRDGINTMREKGRTSFHSAGEQLIKGKTLIIYPEGKHQNKHWLGDFSLGYVHLAFDAAEKDHFQTEIFILPSCNHYSDYYHIQEDALVRYGKPISLLPYYELYQTQPKEAKQKVNRIVRQQVEDLMLHIKDLEHYQAIDYLRNAAFGKNFAQNHNFNPNSLKDKLVSDKILVEKLDNIAPEQKDPVFQDAKFLDDQLKKLKISDKNFDKPFKPISLMIKGLLFVLLFPLLIVSLIPNIFIYLIPYFIMHKVKDKMFTNSIFFCTSVLLTIPIFYTLTFVLLWIFSIWWIGLIYTLLIPFFALFAWNYCQCVKNWYTEIRFRKLFKNNKLENLIEIRNRIFKNLATLLDLNKI